MAEPSQLQRKTIGVYTIAFLIILLLLCILLKKEYWRDVH
jgi:ubiquinol-cytochrome c reductase cytochrome c1 subunit